MFYLCNWTQPLALPSQWQDKSESQTAIYQTHRHGIFGGAEHKESAEEIN